MLTSIIQDSWKATLKLHKKERGGGGEAASLMHKYIFFRLIDGRFVVEHGHLKGCAVGYCT